MFWCTIFFWICYLCSWCTSVAWQNSNYITLLIDQTRHILDVSICSCSVNSIPFWQLFQLQRFVLRLTKIMQQAPLCIHMWQSSCPSSLHWLGGVFIVREKKEKKTQERCVVLPHCKIKSKRNLGTVQEKYEHKLSHYVIFMIGILMIHNVTYLIWARCDLVYLKAFLAQLWALHWDRSSSWRFPTYPIWTRRDLVNP